MKKIKLFLTFIIGLNSLYLTLNPSLSIKSENANLKSESSAVQESYFKLAIPDFPYISPLGSVEVYIWKQENNKAVKKNEPGNKENFPLYMNIDDLIKISLEEGDTLTLLENNIPLIVAQQEYDKEKAEPRKFETVLQEVQEKAKNIVFDWQWDKVTSLSIRSKESGITDLPTDRFLKAHNWLLIKQENGTYSLNLIDPTIGSTEKKLTKEELGPKDFNNALEDVINNYKIKETSHDVAWRSYTKNPNKPLKKLSPIAHIQKVIAQSNFSIYHFIGATALCGIGWYLMPKNFLEKAASLCPRINKSSFTGWWY